MKIAVCDDDCSDRLILKDYIGSFDAALECDLFTSAEELMSAFHAVYYDLVFLDIEMEGMDGFHAAKMITGSGDSPLIIFVTKSSKYIIQGYEVAFRYLVKPLDYEDFSKVMKTAVENIVPKKISIDINGKNHLVSTKDIGYIEVFNHNIRIHAGSSVYDWRCSLKYIEEFLDGSHFARPHNSYLVNLDQIDSVTQSEIIMKDRFKISISRQRKNDFFTALHQYLRR
ncbi:two component transcriptional regulator, LytTR family [Sporobacter termitidis DSM 10068]|uniref:Stage 0 sporulation protein A homolog n=1 Tax=Sporobacter termitidis DSM 10068 TaxID=1123282 RepID=A0A1M5ZDC6_9FIRM|nr:LytTR family DNA-binding domain-containing protein [Sporobacter termitidis]SHI22220.1 two component transcriptional regulator, LytTR family [Sporobacter termitidis DSM 10068]